MPVMSAMAVMMKHMHHRACQNKKPRQDAEDMRGVLGKQEIPSHHQEAAQHQPAWGSPPWTVQFITHQRTPFSVVASLHAAHWLAQKFISGFFLAVVEHRI